MVRRDAQATPRGRGLTPKHVVERKELSIAARDSAPRLGGELARFCITAISVGSRLTSLWWGLVVHSARSDSAHFDEIEADTEPDDWTSMRKKEPSRRSSQLE